MNDAYVKDSSGTDYFDELLERIRSIRASEKRLYQKVRDIFSETSADYAITTIGLDDRFIGAPGSTTRSVWAYN